jgi:hypothetical protein
MSNSDPTHGLTEILSRAISDKDFRDKLLADPDGTLQPLGLSAGDRDTIAKLVNEKRDQIEKAGTDYDQDPAFCGIVVEFKP